MVATTCEEPDIEINLVLYGERQPEPIGEVREIEINGKKFKLGVALPEEVEKKIT